MKKILIPGSIMIALVLGVIILVKTNTGNPSGAQSQVSSIITNIQTSPTTDTTIPPSTTPTQVSGYKDGTYTGSDVPNQYGEVQVQIAISGGKISDVKFLKYPNEAANSQYISSQVTPLLKQEAISAQSAQVDIVSGATSTSESFVESLQNALDQAKA